MKNLPKLPQLPALCPPIPIDRIVEYIRPVSDLHLEFYLYQDYSIEAFQAVLVRIVPPDPRDFNSALILNGDICNIKLIDLVLQILTDRFPVIVFVPGNHDYWGSNLYDTADVFREYENKYPNQVFISTLHHPVILLLKSSIGVTTRLVGTTLWGIGGDNPVSSLQLANLPDFRRITLGEAEENSGKYVSFTPEGMNIFNKIDSISLKLALEAPTDSDQTFVATHYLPSEEFLNTKIHRDVFDNIFYSNQHSLFPRVDLWMFGHTHQCWNVQKETTRFIANSKGYPREFIYGFNPSLFIPLGVKVSDQKFETLKPHGDLRP
jgi:hypothetical protein